MHEPPPRGGAGGSQQTRGDGETRARGPHPRGARLRPDGLAHGWAQYGTLEELPSIGHRRRYDQDPPPRPDWRITCIVVDKRHRGKGIARAALQGALDLIARTGGGRVEAISEVTSGRTAQSRFLGCGTVELFEQFGFGRVRQVGKHAWIVTRVLDPA